MVERPQRIAIWCEGIDRFYSLKPIVENLKARGVKVVIYFPDVHWHEKIAAYLELPYSQVRDMTLGRPWLSRFLGHLSLFLLGNMASKRFSNMYARIISDMPLRYRILRWITPKFNSAINKVYPSFFKLITRDMIRADAVLAVTNMHMPYWLASFEGRLFTLVESWDHPFKVPLLHKPIKAFVWNADLSTDMNHYQAVDCGEPVSPLRLRYVTELAHSGASLEKLAGLVKDAPTRSHVQMLLQHDWVTYICSNSSSNWRVFPEEMRIMKTIAQWGEITGRKVYFKPKPNSKQGDLDFLKEYSCATVGIDGTGFGVQMLDDGYHVYRYLLLKKSKLVVNISTTFGLEASLVGCPILQLAPSPCHSDQGLYSVSLNPHLRKYLYSSPYCFEYNGAFMEIPRLLNATFEGTERRPEKYSEGLREWVKGSSNVEESINVITGALCKDL